MSPLKEVHPVKDWTSHCFRENKKWPWLIERHCSHHKTVDGKGCLPALFCCHPTTGNCHLFMPAVRELGSVSLSALTPFQSKLNVIKDMLFKANLSCFEWSKLGSVNKTSSAEEKGKITKVAVDTDLTLHMTVCRPHNLSPFLVNPYLLEMGHKGSRTSLVHQIWKIGSSEMIRGSQYKDLSAQRSLSRGILVDALYLPIVLRLCPTAVGHPRWSYFCKITFCNSQLFHL